MSFKKSNKANKKNNTICNKILHLLKFPRYMLHFQKMLDLIVKCKEDILLAAESHHQEPPAIFTVSKLTEIENRLRFITGSGLAAPMVVDYPPVTNFLGEEITRPVDITALDLKPTLDQKELFLAKVEALQSTFRDRQPETLISDFSKEPLVIRKVAKNAGLTDYADGLINIEFIDRIKAGLDAIDQRAIEEDLIEEQLGGDTDPLSDPEYLKAIEEATPPTIEVDIIPGVTTDPLSTELPVKQARTTKAAAK